jgi:hypothetical protein
MIRIEILILMLTASGTLLCQRRQVEERFEVKLGTAPEASYKQIIKGLANVEGQPPNPCSFQLPGKTPHRCIGDFALPPFPLRHWYDSDADWGWAPVEQTDLGSAEFENQVLVRLNDRTPVQIAG